jgi:hypothetical protein
VQSGNLHPVGYAGTLVNWTRSGLNAFHSVGRGVAGGTDLALMIFDNNVATLTTGVGANTAGVVYTVAFDLAPAAWVNGSQQTTSVDRLRVQILNAGGTVLRDYQIAAGEYTSSYTFTPQSFTYTGDGSGVVRVKILSLNQSSNRFSGAIDNLSISAAQGGSVMAAVAYVENAAATASAPGLILGDGDDATLAGATVTISTGLTAGDTLSIDSGSVLGGVTANYSSGVLTFTGSTTVANYQAMLRAVAYSSTSEVPTSLAATRTITYQVTDSNGSSGGNGALSAAATVTVTITAVNDAPTLTSIANQTTMSGTATAALAFTVGDAETAPGSLDLSATSSNLAFVPNANIVFGGSGAARTVTVTPVAGQSGTVTITLTASDGSLTGSTSFNVSVDGMGIWAQTYFGNATVNVGNVEDFDSDGVINLLEFAFGTLPNNNTSGSGILQYTGTFAGGGTLTSTGQPGTGFEPTSMGIDFRALFVRRNDYAASGLTYTPQFSANLTTWQDSAAVPAVLADNGTHQVVSVPYPPFIAGKKARFFRISVTKAP